MENYEKKETLGEGMFGVVYLATDKRTGQAVALKKIRVGQDRLKEGIHFTALREIKFLGELKHDNVLHLLDMFQHKSNIHMVLELMYTDLERIVVARHVPLPLGDVQFYTLQLCRGVAFLHSQWVLHRDLKPSNVLASERGELRLADFGLARAFGGHARGAEPMTHQVVTRWYRAPELLFGARHYGGGIDTWAVGCIVAEMLLRGPLLAGESDIDQLAKTFQLLGTPNVDTWPDCEQLPDYVEFDARTPMPLDQLFAAAPADAVQLVQGCLQLDPRGRWSAARALASDYLVNVNVTPQTTLERTARLAKVRDNAQATKVATNVKKRPLEEMDFPVKKKLMWNDDDDETGGR